MARHPETGSDATLIKCVLKDNQAVGATEGIGGGLFAYQSNLTIIDTLFYDNLASGGTSKAHGGAVHMYNPTAFFAN